MIAIAALLAAAASARPLDDTTSLEKLQKEYFEVEMTMERFKRVIPEGFDGSAERKAIEQLAARAKLSANQVVVVPGAERLTLEDGRPAPIEINRLEISGRDSYEAIHFFLSMVRLRPRLTGIESLQLDAAPGESVRYAVRLMYPTWAGTPPERETSRDMATVLRQRIVANRAILDRIVALVKRMEDASAVDRLAVFSKAAEAHAIVLTTARVDQGLSMQGLLFGAAARSALAASLETAGLRGSRIEWSAAGACQAFSISARSERSEETDGFTPASPIFDGDSAAFCRGKPESPAQRIVAGSPTANAFFLRLRDLELVDVFLVLNDLLPENFLIDGDVKGRVHFDIAEDAAVEDALGALRGAGVVIGPGPLRRVSRGKPAAQATRSTSPGGTPINVVLRNASLSDVLCLLGEVSERQLRMSADQQRRISLFMTEVPAGAAIDQLLPPPAAAAVNACELPDTPGSRLSRHPFRLEEMGIADVRIAGLARVGETWKAYVSVPPRWVLSLEPGQRLFDGTVKSIGPRGVTFVSDTKGAIEVPFVP